MTGYKLDNSRIMHNRQDYKLDNPIFSSDGMIKIFTDGACRGNPGLGAFAYIIATEKGDIILRFSAMIDGKTTNNVAEYKAIIAALGTGIAFAKEKVEVYSDSELVVRQATGEYRVKKPHLRAMYEELKEKERAFVNVSYTRVSRDHPMISLCDQLCNDCIDAAKLRSTPLSKKTV